MDTYTKTVAVTVIILIALSILFACTGCDSMIKGVGQLIGIGEKQSTVIPDTPKKQMWETIKGLTPNWLAIPVIALGAVAMFNGAAKLGLSCIIFGSVNLFMALATSRFGFWMALCGLIGSVAAVAASMLVKNKALKEIIGGVQAVKNDMPERYEELREELSHQTKSTKKIVAKIKAKI